MSTSIYGVMSFKEYLSGADRTWKESFGHAGDVSLSEALVDLNILASARVQLLGVGVELTQTFVSDKVIWRDSDIGQIEPTGMTPYGPYYNRAFVNLGQKYFATADFAYSSLNVRLEATPSAAPQVPRYRRTYWISGNPDLAQDIITRDPTSFGGWNAAWNVYKALLAPTPPAISRWGMLVRSRLPGATADTRISGIDPTTGVLTIRALPPGIVPQTQVVVRNVRGLVPRIAGIYMVNTRVDAGAVSQLTLNRVGPSGGGNAFAGSYQGHGYIRALQFVTYPFTNAQIIGYGSKIRGDSIDRGKARAKKPRSVVRG